MKWVLTFALLFPVFWKFTTAENTLSENNFTFKVEAPVQYQVIQREDQNYGWVDVQVSTPETPLSEIQLEHRLVLNGKNRSWEKLSGEWKNQNLLSRLTVPAGGWYGLEIREAGNPDNRSQVVQFGVGEIFWLLDNRTQEITGRKNRRRKQD